MSASSFLTAVIARLRLGMRMPWLVLVPLALTQWIAVGLFATRVQHNGWVYYQGGDETFFYTSSWVLAGGHLPQASIGYGWSYLTAPIALIAGPNYVDALPALILLQTVVLMPLALYCIYTIGTGIGGRAVGAAAAALWVAVPFAAIPLWDPSYHEKYAEQFLPQAFGLTGLGDFPSMVCILVAALFCLRALDGAAPSDAIVAGLAAGFAIGIKPANALFLAGPVLAFAAARRFRLGAIFAAALLPALLALTLWKLRGLGYLPITRTAEAAAGARVNLAGVPGGLAIDRYLALDWSRLRDNYADLRRFLWGVPLWQALPLVGLVAASRRSWPKTLLLAGWLGTFVLVKGSSDQASVEGGTLLRLFMPGFPPLLVLSALLLLFVPALGNGAEREAVAPLRRAPMALAAAVFALLPIVLFVSLPPLRSRAVAKSFEQNVMVPVDRRFTVRASREAGDVFLAWPERSVPGGRAFYRVLRSPAKHSGQEGVRCLAEPRHAYAGALDCRLAMSLVAVTRSTRIRVEPGAGPWVYRVALAANWRDDLAQGDTFVLSPPTVVRGR